MADVPRPSAQARWHSFNVPDMIVMARAPDVDDGNAVTAHNRATADFDDLRESLRIMKIDFSLLDASIIETLAKGPLKLDDLLAVATVRDQALRLNVRRAGVSPSNSADTTINERLQALRRAIQVAYDRPTSRWDVLPISLD
jgi:hypothetical protein